MVKPHQCPSLPLTHVGGKGQVWPACISVWPFVLLSFTFLIPLISPLLLLLLLRDLLSILPSFSFKLHFTDDRRPCVAGQLVRREAGPTVLTLIRFYVSRRGNVSGPLQT